MKQDSIIGKIKYYLLYALNPINVLHEEKEHKWYLHLLLPSIGWLIFFLQVGLDKGTSTFRVVLISILGAIIGYVMVGFSGFAISFILRYFDYISRYDQVISCIALSHTYMAFSVFLGLIYNILGFASATTFGITGLMCTLLPIYAGIRTLSKDSAFMAPLLASLIGVILLASWQLIMKIAL